LFDERLQCSRMNAIQRQRADERVELAQVQRAVLDAGEVHVLLEVACCRLAEHPPRPNPENARLPSLVPPPCEDQFRLFKPARSSAFTKLSSVDLLLDVPDPLA